MCSVSVLRRLDFGIGIMLWLQGVPWVWAGGHQTTDQAAAGGWLLLVNPCAFILHL